MAELRCCTWLPASGLSASSESRWLYARCIACFGVSACIPHVQPISAECCQNRSDAAPCNNDTVKQVSLLLDKRCPTRKYVKSAYLRRSKGEPATSEGKCCKIKTCASVKSASRSQLGLRGDVATREAAGSGDIVACAALYLKQLEAA